MRVLGMISGTSYDAIEAAAVDLALEGDRLVGRLLGHWSTPYPAEVRSSIEACLPPNPTTAEQICRLDTLVGQAFAEAAAGSIDGLGSGPVDLVVSHGQTLYHWVEDGVARGTFQAGQPAWIAERTGSPVVSDLRARDISRGGQGAPLVSLLDRMLLPPGDRPRAALNLGGIANITVVAPDGSALAYDTGPANALLDAAVHKFSGGKEHFDRDGERARRGCVDPGLLEDLLAEPYYRAAPPKSTGKELFNLTYLDRFLRSHRGTGADDVVATLTRLTAYTVAAECRRHGVGSLMVAGGGVRNPVLMAELRALLPGVALSTSADLGIPVDAKEAVAFAVLGFLTVHGLPGTVPSCTGADGPSVLGSLTPGRSPLRLPPPAGGAPRRLVLVEDPARATAQPRLREATDSDLVPMARVLHAAWQSYVGVLPDRTSGCVDELRAGVLVAAHAGRAGSSTTVAEVDERVVGWIRRTTTPDDDAGHVLSLYVDPASARQGVGSRLLRGAAEAAARAGASHMTLWVFEANAAARRFYARHGFSAEGARRARPEFANEPEVLLRAALPLPGQDA